MPDDEDLDPELFIGNYRYLLKQHDGAWHEGHKAIVLRYATRRRDWHGEDSLHEMAFGESIEREG